MKHFIPLILRACIALPNPVADPAAVVVVGATRVYVQKASAAPKRAPSPALNAAPYPHQTGRCFQPT